MVSRNIINYWHGSLMTRIETHVDRGGIFDKNLHINTGDMGISLVQS